MARDPAREGWWTGEAEAADGARYGFALDDGPVPPRPAFAPPARRPGRAERGRGPRAPRVARAVAGTRAARRGAVRAARGHVHPRGHPGRRRGPS
ncbi:hypothetical protein LT493_39380 [Streptomyces tricolor]|nr:hypothetical protein [Streptomyces tricolor]